MQDKVYLDFLKYALNDDIPLPQSSSSIDWMKMMEWAERQTVVGMIYMGIEKAGKSLLIPFDSLMAWVSYAQQIEMQNRLLNRGCVIVTKELKGDGLECLILKGQGNGTTYPNPARRTPGDIDVLVKGVSRRCLTEYVKTRKNVRGLHYEHIEYEEECIPVEIHFKPGVINNPFYNRRLQSWYKEHSECLIVELPDEIGSIPIPSCRFNIIFQLGHMMHHFFDEGIGLRQFVDYYFLLKSDVRSQMDDVSSTLKYLGLWKFAGAVMYVMSEVFALDEQYMVAPVDERRGKVLLQEIMRGGNFGKYDESNIKADNRIKKNIQRIKRDIRMMQYFPSECLWEPVFRAYHFFWRLVYR